MAGALTTALLLVPAAGLAATASGGITTRLVSADPGDLTARSSFDYSLARGSSATGAVVVGNSTPSRVRLAISAVQGLTGVTSGVVYAAREVARRGVARWLSPSVRTLVLAPGASTTVSFSVRVPRRARAGDHVAGLAIEDTTTAAPRPGFGVRQIVRSVVGVVISVRGTARFRPMVSAARIESGPATGRGLVVIRLGDSGLRLGHPELAVTLTRAGGGRRTVRRRLDTLLPGSAIAFPLAWPVPIARGSYRVTVVLQRLHRHFSAIGYR